MDTVFSFLQDRWAIVSTGVLLLGGAMYLLKKKKQAPIAEELTVYGIYDYGEVPGLPDVSPFVIKVETFLREHNIKYVRKNVDFSNPRPGTRGKVPFIEHKGKTITDSRFIIDYLRKEFHIPDESTPEQKALTHAYTQTLEQSLYWAVTYVIILLLFPFKMIMFAF
eukprot:TRINITY_DN7217_c0_g1_i4.p1 TRINITY_DN7217_c0_g1~~TRINITY_DN7217_c0_g1_i4.p1  ORF type:complete len:166 (-),score=5.95 TRINITY_DN7217_c0_g1_i4:10-507(-)